VAFQSVTFYVANKTTSALFGVWIEAADNVVTKTGKIGGVATTCRIYIRDGHNSRQHDYFGLAVCCPPDQYDFLRGARLALTRALDSMGAPRDYRVRFFAGLHARLAAK
jgi:hypothetical protein